MHNVKLYLNVRLNAETSTNIDDALDCIRELRCKSFYMRRSVCQVDRMADTGFSDQHKANFEVAYLVRPIKMKLALKSICLKLDEMVAHNVETHSAVRAVPQGATNYVPLT